MASQNNVLLPRDQNRSKILKGFPVPLKGFKSRELSVRKPLSELTLNRHPCPSFQEQTNIISEQESDSQNTLFSETKGTLCSINFSQTVQSSFPLHRSNYTVNNLSFFGVSPISQDVPKLSKLNSEQTSVRVPLKIIEKPRDPKALVLQSNPHFQKENVHQKRAEFDLSRKLGLKNSGKLYRSPKPFDQLSNHSQSSCNSIKSRADLLNQLSSYSKMQRRSKQSTQASDSNSSTQLSNSNRSKKFTLADHYDLLENIGSGASSIIRKVRRISDGKLFALKTYKDVKETRKGSVESYLLSRMSHSSVINLEKLFRTSNNVRYF